MSDSTSLKMDKCCKLSLQGSVNYYSSSDFWIIAVVRQPQRAQWCSCRGQPGGSNQLLTVLWSPEQDFPDEWVSWSLGRGVDCLMIPTLVNDCVVSKVSSGSY